jgi:hypothetical protein
MALYKHLTRLYKYGWQSHEIFDQEYSPGGTVPWSGSTDASAAGARWFTRSGNRCLRKITINTLPLRAKADGVL